MSEPVSEPVSEPASEPEPEPEPELKSEADAMVEGDKVEPAFAKKEPEPKSAANMNPPVPKPTPPIAEKKTETAVDVPVVDKPKPTILNEAEKVPDAILLKDVPVDKDKFEKMEKASQKAIGGVMKAYNALTDDTYEKRPEASKVKSLSKACSA